ncbi:MAG: DUF1284 domain-containing protein [Thermodesulfobacteriota bacterium]
MSRLRGHHLVCLRFYQGEGFPQSYKRNLHSVVMTAKEEGVSVVSGADEVCAFCPYLKDGLCSHAMAGEEEIRAMDEAAMELLGVTPQERISWEELGVRVERCIVEWRKRFCAGCLWKEACRSNPSQREEANS